MAKRLRSCVQPPTLHGKCYQPIWWGFWRTETIATAVKLKILNNLPGTTEEIASRSNLPKSRVERLLRALWELDVVYVKDADWHFTLKGQGLAPQEHSFLAAAARMWSDVNAHAWRHLPNAIRSNTISVPSFKAHASDDQLHYYHQALDGYAYEDFSAWQIPHSWQFHQKLISVGRTAKIWLERLLQHFPHQQAVLLGEEYILRTSLSRRKWLSAIVYKHTQFSKPGRKKLMQFYCHGYCTTGLIRRLLRY